MDDPSHTRSGAATPHISKEGPEEKGTVNTNGWGLYEDNSAREPLRSPRASRATCYHKPMKIFGILLSMFIVIPIVEFALLIEIGRRLGTIDTLLLIFGTGILGAYLARLEGFRILYRIQRDLASGTIPGEQLFDGLLVLVSGVVLITPGLLTDIVGLLLLFPPTRYPIKSFIRRRVRNRVSARGISLTF